MFRVTVFLVTLFGSLSVALGYFAVSSDDSGQFLAAADRNDGIYVSSNYGAKWSWSTTHTSNTWTGLSSDGSGKKLTLSSSATLPYISSDGGASWNKSVSGHSTSSSNVAADGSGKNLVLAGNDDLYLSSDSGSNWAAVNLKPFPSVQAIDFSADGSTIIYSYNSYISVAKNGKWLGPTASPSAVWYAVSTNKDGSVIAGVIYDENANFDPNAKAQRGVYLSTDGGASYTALAVSSASYEYFYAVEVSDDGSLLYYGGSGGLWVYHIATKTTTFATCR